MTKEEEIKSRILTAEELKSGGFIPQRQKDLVAIRCRAPGGRLEGYKLRKLADVAEKYGDGTVHLSTRMSPEILYINMKDINNVIDELGSLWRSPIATCGSRVRVPTACGGCEYNPRGWTDTQKFAVDADKKYFGTNTYHKFKIAFTGCVIDCMRTREMDLGFQGMVKPKLVEDLCTSCGLCAHSCNSGALEMVNEFPKRMWDMCISCGDCINICPSNALIAENVGHAVYVGGKHGRNPHVAYPIAEFLPDNKVFDVIDGTLSWYKLNGKPRERIGFTIDRVGIDSYREYMKEIIGIYLLSQKDIEKTKWRDIFWRGVADRFPIYGNI